MAFIGLAVIAVTAVALLVTVVKLSPYPYGWNEAPMYEAMKKQQEETKDWDTYRNEEFGFEFKYPDFFQQNNAINNKSYFISENSGYIYLEIGNEKFDPSNIKDYLESSPEPIPIKNAVAGKFNGRDWYSYDGGQEGCTAYVYQTGLKDETLILSFYDCGERGALKVTDADFIKKILLTFKFIESTAQTDTSTWKTYRNEQYGFEFKYPQDWSLADSLVLGKINIMVYADSLKNLPVECELGDCLPNIKKTLDSFNTPSTPGVIVFDKSRKGIIKLFSTYEGGPPFVPVYRFFTGNEKNYLYLTLEDGSYNCEEKSQLSCESFLKKITPGQKTDGVEYSSYNKFIDLLNGTFKFVR
ncbi:MAG: hypothetical protein Q8N81_02460 [bacterium]|nr:hypothetical protein [bacterium]